MTMTTVVVFLVLMSIILAITGPAHEKKKREFQRKYKGVDTKYRGEDK